MAPVTVDEQDRHLLAVAVVWVVVAIVLFLGGAVLLGVAWRLFAVVAGLG